ncbi:MAG: AAA family ATPase [Actinomycetia bacterium]|nr:AAA family ATPase [Actinomycetes bacterium]
MKNRKLELELDQSWVLSQREAPHTPVEVLTSEFSSSVTPDSEVTKTAIASCEFLIKNPNLSEDTLIDSVYELLRKHFEIDDPKKVITCTVSEEEDKGESESSADETEAKSEEKSVLEKNSTKKSDENDTPVPPEKPILQRIQDLAGGAEFKQLAEECALIAPQFIKTGRHDSFTARSYLFAVNEGYGFTTSMELFSELLDDIELLKATTKNPVLELTLSRQVNSQDKSISDARDAIKTLPKDGGRIVCLDIREWMGATDDPAFRELLKDITKKPSGAIVVFRVPFVEKAVLNKLADDISDILLLRTVSIVPFSKEELLECARSQLKNYGFTLDEKAASIFEARVSEEKSDGRFYGIDTVGKIVNDMIYHKLLANAKKGRDDTEIMADDISALAKDVKSDTLSGFEQLDALVGMNTIKQRVREIIAQVETSLSHGELASPSIHMRFVGNPGTGKTTVARIVGKLLKEKGVLRNGDFFEYNGRDFCGRYVGETAPKTASMCRDAYGSVIFIDEAYSLFRGDDSSYDYGREALDTLISEMENHRNDFVVIMAGYTDEMATLMRGNAGLESRMPYLLEFSNYGREDLYGIFMSLVEGSAHDLLKYDDAFAEAAHKYFLALNDDAITAKEFSNARFVRNLFERTWGKAVLREQFAAGSELILNKNDFELASGEREFAEVASRHESHVGFMR